MDTNRIIRAGALLAALCISACGKTGRDEAEADLFIYGGSIYTGVDESPKAEAVAVRDGRVLAVGAFADIKGSIGDGTRRIDLAGAALYPGFIDAHAHLLGIGLREMTLNLEGVASIDELVDIVGAEVVESEAGAVVQGRGWIETGWPEGRFPTRDDFDPVSGDNPVLLLRSDGHALVANSAALSKAGIDQQTPDPDGGRIERDAAGRPTGMLIDKAMALVDDLMQAPTAAQKERAYSIGASVYAERGWTGLHNMSVDPADVEMIERMATQKDDGIKLRVYNVLRPDGMSLVADGPRLAAAGRIVTRAVKYYVDGALGSRGAALNEPYSDMPQTRGLLLLDHYAAIATFVEALRTGVQIATHAIGDRGNTIVLDWYEEAFAATPANDRKIPEPRWRIEHAQVLSSPDLPRFSQLGVIASMQPSHAIGDLYFAPARLGDDRLDGAYAWKSLLDSGAVIAGGSDAPVERGSPLVEFYAAIARTSINGFQGTDWRPEQSVSREAALKMFTAAPAFASFQENDLGTIEPGKKADFSVFSADLMVAPPAQILAAKAVMTVVDGDIIYHHDPN